MMDARPGASCALGWDSTNAAPRSPYSFWPSVVFPHGVPGESSHRVYNTVGLANSK